MPKAKNVQPPARRTPYSGKSIASEAAQEPPLEISVKREESPVDSGFDGGSVGGTGDSPAAGSSLAQEEEDEEEEEAKRPKQEDEEDAPLLPRRSGRLGRRAEGAPEPEEVIRIKLEQEAAVRAAEAEEKERIRNARVVEWLREYKDYEQRPRPASMQTQGFSAFSPSTWTSPALRPNPSDPRVLRLRAQPLFERHQIGGDNAGTVQHAHTPKRKIYQQGVGTCRLATNVVANIGQREVLPHQPRPSYIPGEPFYFSTEPTMAKMENGVMNPAFNNLHSVFTRVEGDLPTVKGKKVKVVEGVKVEQGNYKMMGLYTMIWAGRPLDGEFLNAPEEDRRTVIDHYMFYLERYFADNAFDYIYFVFNDCYITDPTNPNKTLHIMDKSLKGQDQILRRRIEESLEQNDGAVKSFFAFMQWHDLDEEELNDCITRKKPAKGRSKK